MSSKYDALKSYLSGVDKNRVELNFNQIETIVGELPSTAQTDRSWWGNTRNKSRVQARSWMSIGWRVDQVVLTAQTVVFKRA